MSCCDFSRIPSNGCTLRSLPHAMWRSTSCLKSCQATDAYDSKSSYNISLLCFTSDHALTRTSNSCMISASSWVFCFALLAGSEFTAVCWQVADILFVPRPWPLPLLEAAALMTVYAQSNNGCNSTFSWPHCMFLSQVFTQRGYWWFSQSALQGTGAFIGTFQGDSCPVSK